VTWPHQDTYYLDAEEIGRMTAAWVAVEDIAPSAGPFFVYPKSHLIDMAKNGGDFDIAFHHERYKEFVKQVIGDHALVCRAPALSKGDVLFWAARTIHAACLRQNRRGRAAPSPPILSRAGAGFCNIRPECGRSSSRWSAA
jgi:phytanoyl-CoA hydroxylase